MINSEPTREQSGGGRRALAPLHAAGFVTAFGAHAIAANLAGYTGGAHASLITLGLLLAVYDGAEVVLKPVFGSLADRIGARPVLLGGLLAFAAVSAAFVLAGNPALVALARLGQGAAAAAFSPAAGVLVTRLTGASRRGRGFGRYGAWKSLGYALGPIVGGALVAVGGDYALLFATLAVLGAGVAAWAALTVPDVPPLPKARQTLVGLARRLGSAGFVVPTAALAATTAALSVAVGFLPVLAAQRGIGAVVTGAVVSATASAAALVQPPAGRLRDRGVVEDRSAMAGGMCLTALGCASVLIPGTGGLIVAAVVIGVGAGIVTPIGFAHLAATSPTERLGQTMGSAEVGRELGDAGGPLFVGALAAAITLAPALLAFASVLAVLGSVVAVPCRRASSAPSPSPWPTD